MQWPVPKTVKDLRYFLGFCSYYQRFIVGFAKVAGPLHNVINMCTKRAVGFSAISYSRALGHQNANRHSSILRKRLLALTCYIFPSCLYWRPTSVVVVAILYQCQGGKKRVIASASQRLKGVEHNDQNYSSLKLSW